MAAGSITPEEAAALAPASAKPRPKAHYILSSFITDWVSSVDHKRLGIMYIVSALCYLVVAGLMATCIRVQLFFPYNTFLAPDTFNRMFTMHGTSMVFFVGMPMVAGLGNYLVPLMIGARDMAFPRLNAFGFWIFFFGAAFLYFSYIGGGGLSGAGTAPDVGWFAYAPLTSATYSRGLGVEYWNLSLILTGIGSLATAVNIVSTTLCLRCPGMTMGRMPLFVWIMLVVAALMIAALPPLTAAQIMLLLDRDLGANFFNTQAGGSAILWQHFFWIFGHPEVYILMLPGFAILNEIIPVFSRKPIFGYPIMVGATVAIGFISMAVWAHHMFSVGMTSTGNKFFATTTLIIAVPTGIKIFNWIGTMWGGKLRFDVPMLCCIAVLFQFLCAGLTGVMLAVAPFDWQLTDSYFVVAHFHYVLIGGLLFSIFGAIYYWYPKVTGRMLGVKAGLWHFWLFVVGFNLTFGPQHISGILGMPRRIYTYKPGLNPDMWHNWEIYNQLSTIGVAIQIAAMLFLVYNLIHSAFRGKLAGDNPWSAWTLEWLTPSPPPSYNFETLPEVSSRRPLWDLRYPNDKDGAHE